MMSDDAPQGPPPLSDLKDSPSTAAHNDNDNRDTIRFLYEPHIPRLSGAQGSFHSSISRTPPTY